MAQPAEYRTLLEEIDSRQDEVLEQLNQLSSKAELLIKEALAWRADGEIPSALSKLNSRVATTY